MNQTPLYKRLEKELEGYKKLLSQAAEVIRVRDVSNFPIFLFRRAIKYHETREILWESGRTIFQG